MKFPHIFHDWSKWEQYTEKITYIWSGLFLPDSLQGKEYEGSVNRQRRHCLVCNMVEIRNITAD